VIDGSVTLWGNATRDPEMRFSATGTSVTSFGIAVSHRYQSGGQWKEEASFIDVTLFGQAGENAAASISKGMRVCVTGRLKREEWTGSDGEKKSKLAVIAEDVGVSLRWATASVERTVRDKPAETRQQSNRQAPAEPLYSDEEPFISLYRGHQSYRNLHLEAGF
jgi:single-strand DNA-binding protein